MTAPERINKLKAAMQGMAGTPDTVVVPLAPAAPRPIEAPAVRATLSPSRRGKKNVSAYIEATAAKQLRLLAVELETSTQALVKEALNDLFRKHGKSAIA